MYLWCELLQALAFFGPLTTEQLRDKLLLRGHDVATTEIDRSLSALCLGYVYPATGFGTSAWRAAHIDSWRDLPLIYYHRLHGKISPY